MVEGIGPRRGAPYALPELHGRNLHSQNAKAILRVVEGHAVDEPGQDLGWRARPGCLRHQGMMETKIPLDQARVEGQAVLATGKGLEGADAA